MTMRTLLLMRHAKSDWSSPGKNDHDRPLNKRGIRAATFMGNLIERSFPLIDIVLASSAVRVQQTLELMKEEWVNLNPKIVSSRDLYLASPKSILTDVSRVASNCSSVLVIAHNPGLEELTVQLSRQEFAFPTACVVVFQSVAESWIQAVKNEKWELEQVFKPRELE